MCLETMAGLTVTCLDSGVKAVAQAANIKPDLILLDVMMPSMDGPSTLAALRQNKALDTIPIVFMTARVQPEVVEKYMELGAAAVVPKPFDPVHLAQQISDIYQQWIEKHRN